MIKACKLDPTKLITHHFRLDEIVHAYDIFKNAAQEQAIKIVLTNTAPEEPAADDAVIRQIVAQVLSRL